MKFEKQLKSISWNELESWVGPRVFRRGESYFKDGRVKDLVTCPEGLIANVKGGNDYVTLVSFAKSPEDSELKSRCTCPYGTACKHAVAVLLTYVDAVKNKKEISEAKSADKRLKRIEGPRQDDLEDDFGKQYGEEEKPTVNDWTIDLSNFLEKHSKESLVSLVLELTSIHSDLRQDLLDRSRLSSGKTKEIVSSIRRELTSVMAEPAWHSHWSDEGHLANFSRVEGNLKNLFDHGNYEAVVDLTKFLLARAYPYIESSNDDGDSARQISDCLGIGFRALEKCPWPSFDKLLFAIDSQLGDSYDLCHGASGVIDGIDDKETWSKIADHFYQQLKNQPTSSTKEEFSRNYHRDRVSNILVHALERSKRSDEVQSIYESEAKNTGSWERFVCYLIEKKQFEKARIVAKEGIQDIGNKWPGITRSLRQMIADLAAKQGDYNGILLLRQEDFLDNPHLSSFEALLEAAIKTKNRDEMRTWALHYLETGKASVKGALKETAQQEVEFQCEFPQYETLINIAEKENRVEHVWSLYKAAMRKRNYFNSQAQVARIVQDRYPEESIKIWSSLAEDHIAKTNPASYVTAVSYLKEVQRIYLKTKRTKEWSNYIERLKEANNRKPRFIKELRRLTDEKLLR